MSTQCIIYTFLDDSKQDAANTNAHSKRLIELSIEQKVLTSTLSTIGEILIIVQINIEMHQHYTLC